MKLIKFISIITLSAFLFIPAILADDDAPELPTAANPNVAKNVRHEDAPLDHAATKDAAEDSVKMSGAGDPLKKTEPVNSHWTQSGKFPEDTYEYIVGPDGKVYGKGQTPPQGETKKLTIKLTYDTGSDSWVSYAEITHDEGNWTVTDGIGSNMPDADLPSDQGKGFESDLRNEARRQKFHAKDPKTAARAALVNLQMHGKLYDPNKEIEEPKKEEKPDTKDKEKEKEPEKPERQAHPVHGSRQAHPVHGSPNFGDDLNMKTGNDVRGQDVGDSQLKGEVKED